MYKTYLQKWLVLPIVIALLSAMMPTSVAAATPAVEVQSSASSAVLYEPTSGRVLFEKQAHVKRPMASTTKLMTALLAAELLSPTAMLTASEDALRVEGSSMGLSVGDVVSRDDLLRGLLLSSGNDAANVLALSMAESFEAFACVMNARAALIGMSNSHFVTPSGLDAEGHGSTAYDMALLAAEVLKNETLASICSAQSAFVTVGDRQFALTNHNKLLAQYPDCIGLKTGYTSLAGRCLVSAARRDGVTLIAVTLDCANDWEEHRTMLDEGFALMTCVTMPPVTIRVPLYGANETEIVAKADGVSLTVPTADARSIEMVYKRPSYEWAPIERGDCLGTVEYRLRTMVLATVPIKAETTVPPKERDSWWKRTETLFWLLLYEMLT